MGEEAADTVAEAACKFVQVRGLAGTAVAWDVLAGQLLGGMCLQEQLLHGRCLQQLLLGGRCLQEQQWGGSMHAAAERHWSRPTAA
jgi:hypothetical protein